MATSLSTRADQAEIASLRWFTRAELTEAIATGAVRAAGTVSIAGQILHSWLENE